MDKPNIVDKSNDIQKQIHIDKSKNTLIQLCEFFDQINEKFIEHNGKVVNEPIRECILETARSRTNRYQVYGKGEGFQD